MNISVAALLMIILSMTFTSAAKGQSLRFFATPFEVYEGDAVVFNYLEEDRPGGAATVKLSQIVGWRWDFNGDGTWDEQHDVGDPDPKTSLPITIALINATWYSTITNGEKIQNFTPRLQVREAGDPAFDSDNFIPKSATGVTEDVFGTDSLVDPDMTVKNRAVGNPDLSVNFTMNPRLARTTDTVRLYSSITPADGRTHARMKKRLAELEANEKDRESRLARLEQLIPSAGGEALTASTKRKTVKTR